MVHFTEVVNRVGGPGPVGNLLLLIVGEAGQNALAAGVVLLVAVIFLVFRRLVVHKGAGCSGVGVVELAHVQRVITVGPSIHLYPPQQVDVAAIAGPREAHMGQRRCEHSGSCDELGPLLSLAGVLHSLCTCAE